MPYGIAAPGNDDCAMIVGNPQENIAMRAPRIRIRRRERYGFVPGTPPGTVIISPVAHKPVMHVMAYNEKEFTESPITDIEEIRRYLSHWAVTWVNVDGLGDAQTIQRLGDMFGLHRLALEDVVEIQHRPKVDTYGDHLFFVTRMIEEGFPVRTEQFSIFVGKRFVLTFQERPGGCLDPVRKRIRESLGRIRNSGADYLAYSLIDAVVDAYYPFLDSFAERVEAIEEEVLSQPTPVTVSAIHKAKRDLMIVRRVISPTRETINSVLRDGGQPITEATRIYLRDCYDHTVHVLEMVELYREILAGLLDVYLSSVSNRMNEIMKVLTIIATIFIPLSFIAGVYGMNFDTGASPFNMPELRWKFGYLAFLLLVAGVAAFELSYFWRKGWLGERKHKTEDEANDNDQK
jgi:magnesium transporter